LQVEAPALTKVGRPWWTAHTGVPLIAIEGNKVFSSQIELFMIISTNEAIL
jgi:hypothetical protein